MDARRKPFEEKRLKIEDCFLEGHTSTVGAALIAKKSKVERLKLIHHYPFFSNNFLKKSVKLAQKIFRNSELILDLEEIYF